MNKIAPAIIASTAILLGACSSNDDDNNNSNKPTGPTGDVSAGTEITLDASQNTAYLDLISGKVVQETERWDLAFSRSNVTINPKGKSGIAHTKSAFYNGGNPASSQQPAADNGQQFVNATNNNQLPSLLGAKKIIGQWIKAGIKPAIDNWYQYNPTTHQLTPTNTFFIVQSAAGNSYAKATISEIENTNKTLTVKLNLQQSGDQKFQATDYFWSPSFASDGETCYDFESNNEMADCNNSDWDLKFSVGNNGRAMAFYTNGGESGSGKGAAYKMQSENEYDRGSFDGTNGLPAMAYSKDVPAGAFSSYSWYAYDPVNAGDHKLWPNYRVYVIDTQTAIDTLGQEWLIPGHPLKPTERSYILRSAESNSFAKFSAKTINFVNGAYEISYEFSIQSATATSFASPVTWDVTSGSAACYDFDSQSEISCSGASWDIQFHGDQDLTLTINGGLKNTGGNAAFYTVPQGEAAPAGVDTADQPEWQMLEPYKLQMTDYYNDSGASGHISLRYMPLSQTSVQ